MSNGTVRNPFNTTLAEIVRQLGGLYWMSGQQDLAADLRYVADAIPHFPKAMPLVGYCPYCVGKYTVVDYRKPYPYGEEVVKHRMRVIKKLCDKDPEYEFGYRTIWKCMNPSCGEMEVR